MDQKELELSKINKTELKTVEGGGVIQDAQDTLRLVGAAISIVYNLVMWAYTSDQGRMKAAKRR